jgi:hypothetical protein
MTMAELSFIAEAQGEDGATQLYYVYRTDDSYYVTGPTGYRHICHQTVRTWDAVKHDIELIFKVKITATKQSWEYTNPGT